MELPNLRMRAEADESGQGHRDAPAACRRSKARMESFRPEGKLTSPLAGREKSGEKPQPRINKTTYEPTMRARAGGGRASRSRRAAV